MTIPAGLRRTVLRAQRDTGFLAAGVLPHLALVPVWSWAATTTARTGNWLLTVSVSAALVLLGTPVLTAVQRARHRVLIGVDVPRLTPTVPEQWTWASTARWLAATRPWRKIGYHLLLGPLLALLELLVLAVAAACLAGVSAYAWSQIAPGSSRCP